MHEIIYVIGLIFAIIGIINVTKQIKNEKDEKIQTILTIISGMLFFPIVLLLLDFMDIGNYINLSNLVSKEAWLNFLGTYFSGISAALLSAYIVIIMTNKQIERQSIETYRPRLKMNSAKVFKNDEDIYLYGLSSNNTKDIDPFSGEYKNARLNVSLKNIGVGLAQDICFYNLNSGEECIRALFGNPHKDQKMFSTEEIAKGDELSFDFDLRYLIHKNETGIKREDFSLILCVYKDINGNMYTMLIGIIIKNEIEKEEEPRPIIDSYYYQENTASYNNMIKKYKSSYSKIEKEISSANKLEDEEIPKDEKINK